MWGGMWSSGRRGGDDPERKRCVVADAARKRAARRYTNRGLSLPPSLLRRETEEYDRRQARRFDAGPSSGARPHRIVKTEPGESEEAPPLRSMKTEPGEEPPRGRGVVGPEDYLVGPKADAFEAALAARTAREHEEEEARRQRDEEVNALLYEQGLAAARAFDDQQAGWRHEAEEQDKIYIDLGSDDDED